MRDGSTHDHAGSDRRPSTPFAHCRSRPYWLDHVPTVEFESLPLATEADVVVIGAGLTGLSAARSAARRGASVTVLEAGAVAGGASSRNAGMCHPGYSVGPARLVARYGKTLGEAIYRDSEDAYDLVRSILVEEAIDADVVETGQLGLAFAPKHVPDFRDEQRDLAAVGVETRFLERTELRGELASDRYYAGLLAPRCMGVNPARLALGLAIAAQRYGATVHERTPARSLERTADGRVSVRTPRGAILTREVIVATSGHTGGLVPWLRRRIVPVSSYVIVTEPLDAALARAIAPHDRMYYDSKNFLYYWRLTPDRRLLFGGRASFMPTSIARTRSILYRGMTSVFPSLDGISLDYAWSGRVDLTYDRMPHVGRHGGTAYVVGFNGSGVALTVFLGTRTGEWLTGGPAPNLTQIAFPLIPAPFEGRPWFMPIVGEWYRMQDRLAARSIPRDS